MLTAKEISDVVALLQKIDKATAKQWDDPVFCGTVAFEAFNVGLPLRMELATLKVAVTSEE